MLSQQGDKYPAITIQRALKDNGAFYHYTEYVEGVSISQLHKEDQKVVVKELLQHVATFKVSNDQIPGAPDKNLICSFQRGRPLPVGGLTAARNHRRRKETMVFGTISFKYSHSLNTTLVASCRSLFSQLTGLVGFYCFEDVACGVIDAR